MKLKDKVAIITGAGGGIGQGIAEVFAEEGATAVIAERHAANGQHVADTIRAKGGRALCIQCDVAVENDVNGMVEQTVGTCGRIDVLINNAGINSVKAFEDLTAAEWDHVLGVDLRGTFLCTKACIRHFLNQGGGAVVNIASVHTHAAYPGSTAYDAAKWAVVGLTKALAVEYAARNVRFNCLSPGLIDTQIWQDIQNAAGDLDACMAHWRANIPMGRVGLPREMGRIAAFLASDEASYVTGANLMADGGMTAQLVSKDIRKDRLTSDAHS